MANDKFSIKEALNYGWETFKSHAGFFIGILIAAILITGIPQFMVNRLFPGQTVMHYVGAVVVRLLGVIIGIILTRIILTIHDENVATVPDLGGVLSVFLSYVVARILLLIVLVIGFILLIVPGVILSYMFMYVGFLIVDRSLGPIEAFTESKAITNGYKWDLFLFSLVMFLLNVAGALFIGLGLLVTIPVSMMASVYIYRRLSPAAAAA